MELTNAELAEQQVELLPQREALSLVDVDTVVPINLGVAVNVGDGSAGAILDQTVGVK